MVFGPEQTARAAERWPGVVIGHDELLAYVTALRAANEGERGAQAIGDDALAELYLACGCGRGDSAALNHFDRHYLSAIPAALAHMRLSADTVDEVRQRVRHKLLVDEPSKADEPSKPGVPSTRLERYAGQGKLRGLIGVIAVRQALTILRKDRRLAPGGGDQLMDMPSPERDPELAFLQERYRAEFKRAFEQAVRKLDSRDRNFLRLHLFGGLTVEAVGKVYGVHRATATRWLAKLRKQLLKDTQAALRERLNIDRDELDSLMQLIQSRLDVSMQRVLQTMQEPEEPG